MLYEQTMKPKHPLFFLLLAALLRPASVQPAVPDETPEPPASEAAAPKSESKPKPKAKVKHEVRQQNVDSGASREEMLFWDSIKDSENPEDFEAYLEQYPKGRFARLARNRLANGGESAQPSTPAAALSPPASSAGPAIEPEMVHLPTGIAIGKYEVTQAQWRSVMGANPANFSDCGDACPVEHVSWEDVQDYIARLNALTGKRYRLPTEREWLKACLAKRDTRYCGSNDADVVAWYDTNADERTHPVGAKSPNSWGVYDMSGNVWEWTDSCYADDCSRHVDRGGAWNLNAEDLRTAIRSESGASGRSADLGFRLAED
jgi:hypothetical protein